MASLGITTRAQSSASVIIITIIITIHNYYQVGWETRFFLFLFCTRGRLLKKERKRKMPVRREEGEKKLERSVRRNFSLRHYDVLACEVHLRASVRVREGERERGSRKPMGCSRTQEQGTARRAGREGESFWPAAMLSAEGGGPECGLF